LAGWDVRAGSRYTGTDSVPSRRPLRLDLLREFERRPGGAGVRAWSNPRHQPFPVDVRLPRNRYYRGQAQLVKLYRPEHASSPTRLTVKLPATDLRTAEQTLQQLAREWFFGAEAVGTWSAEA